MVMQNLVVMLLPLLGVWARPDPSRTPLPAVIVVNTAGAQVEISELAEVAGPEYGAVFRFTNRSDAVVVGIDFYLWGPDCPREQKKPLWPLISYGVRFAGSRKASFDEPPLRPHGRGQARIPGKWLEDRRRYARSKGCDATARPELVVTSIQYENGETWTNSAECTRTPALCDGK